MTLKTELTSLSLGLFICEWWPWAVTSPAVGCLDTEPWGSSNRSKCLPRRAPGRWALKPTALWHPPRPMVQWGRLADRQRGARLVWGPGSELQPQGSLGFQPCCLSLAAGPFTLRTDCVRAGQLHTLELSFIQLPPFFPPSPFPWLKILSKVENTPERGPLRAGDCPPPWAALALGRNTHTCPDLSQPRRLLSPASSQKTRRGR